MFRLKDIIYIFVLISLVVAVIYKEKSFHSSTKSGTLRKITWGGNVTDDPDVMKKAHFVVRIVVRRHLDYRKHYTGIYVSEVWVLTVAEALYFALNESEYYRRSLELCFQSKVSVDYRCYEPGMERNSSDLYIHPTYRYHRYKKAYYSGIDLGLIKLDRPVDVNEHDLLFATISLHPIDRKTHFTDPFFINCTLFGWGIIKTEFAQPDAYTKNLRYAPMGQLQECKNYPGQGFHMCVKDTPYAAYPCLGDSGGPLVCGNYVIGLYRFNLSKIFKLKGLTEAETLSMCDHRSQVAIIAIQPHIEWISKTILAGELGFKSVANNIYDYNIIYNFCISVCLHYFILIINNV